MSPWRAELFHNPATAGSRPLIATSACLLGEPVRYDGGHRYQSAIELWLAPHLQLQAVCPEVGIGLGVPRPTIQVIGPAHDQRVVATEDAGLDVTDALNAYADQHAAQIGPFWPLCAWVFKARSPSCGVGSTPVNPETPAEYPGYGRFAGRLAAAADWLLLREEEDLQDQASCREFLLQVYLCRDILWQAPAADPASLAEHYGSLLDEDLAVDSALELWARVAAITSNQLQKRRELVEQYRAS